MNNAVNRPSLACRDSLAASSAIRRSKLVAHSHALTRPAVACRVYTSALTRASFTRSDQHLLNHAFYASNKPVARLKPDQPAIEFIVISRHITNLNASKTKINGEHLSVGQQSALRAGDGGFNVNVKGKTDLVGGAITSSDKAVQDKTNT